MATDVFRYWPNTRGFQSLTADPDESFRLARLIGRRLWAEWTAPAVRTTRRVKSPLSDFPHFWPTIPVFSERALAAVSPLLGDRVEALPFAVEGQSLYLINVLDVVDCLDAEQSTICRNIATGHIESVVRYTFHPERVAGHHLFRIPQTAELEVLVSSAFRDAVRANELTGFGTIILP